MSPSHKFDANCFVCGLHDERFYCLNAVIYVQWAPFYKQLNTLEECVFIFVWNFTFTAIFAILLREWSQPRGRRTPLHILCIYYTAIIKKHLRKKKKCVSKRKENEEKYKFEIYTL